MLRHFNKHLELLENVRINSLCLDKINILQSTFLGVLHHPEAFYETPRMYNAKSIFYILSRQNLHFTLHSPRHFTDCSGNIWLHYFFYTLLGHFLPQFFTIWFYSYFVYCLLRYFTHCRQRNKFEKNIVIVQNDAHCHYLVTVLKIKNAPWQRLKVLLYCA